jgi:hypothetical protein
MLASASIAPSKKASGWSSSIARDYYKQPPVIRDSTLRLLVILTLPLHSKEKHYDFAIPESDAAPQTAKEALEAWKEVDLIRLRHRRM